MIRVKICGVTRPEDAALACELGAHAIGMVFTPSPRQVDVERAAEVVAAIPPLVDRVGVFMNAPRVTILEMVERVGLTRIQLHGDETPDDAAQLPRSLIRALSFTGNDLLPLCRTWRERFLDLDLLLDLPKTPDEDASRAMAEMWQAAGEVMREHPIILAGRLDPDNVGAAIARVSPAAVDTARGVEAAPGIKDPEKLRRFFAAVAAADHEARP